MFWQLDCHYAQHLVVHNVLAYDITLKKVIPTFTVQDILDLLPGEIEKDDKNYCLNVFRNYKTYFVSYHWCDNPLISFENELFINAAYDMLCWCVENGYTTTNEFNHESKNNLSDK